MDKSKELIFDELLNNPIFSKFCKDIKPFPKQFYRNLADVKAIVLGADPSNPENKKLEYVFGLENESSPYFTPILKNLGQLDLSLDNIYVQNLCPNYFVDVTDENDGYLNIAEKYWLPVMKMELDSQFSPDVPVFVTAWKPLIALVPEAAQYQNNKISIYENTIVFMNNKLDHPVIALFRGGWRKGFNGYYDLRYQAFRDYVSGIQKLL